MLDEFVIRLRGYFILNYTRYDIRLTYLYIYKTATGYDRELQELSLHVNDELYFSSFCIPAKLCKSSFNAASLSIIC